MKMPRWIIRIGAQDFVIASKTGVGLLTELMAEAVPVNDRTHLDPPEIELSYADRPDLIPYFQQVLIQAPERAALPAPNPQLALL